jgi:hypothetical protein
VNAVRARTRECFARRAGARAERDDRDLAIAFDARPMLARIELRELAGALVHLRRVVGRL